jgi:hypothetical protein
MRKAEADAAEAATPREIFNQEKVAVKSRERTRVTAARILRARWKLQRQNREQVDIVHVPMLCSR